MCRYLLIPLKLLYLFKINLIRAYLYIYIYILQAITLIYIDNSTVYQNEKCVSTEESPS